MADIHASLCFILLQILCKGSFLACGCRTHSKSEGSQLFSLNLILSTKKVILCDLLAGISFWKVHFNPFLRITEVAQLASFGGMWGEKSLFDSHFHITVHHQKKSGQELKQQQKLMQRPWGVLLTGLLLNLHINVYYALFSQFIILRRPSLCLLAAALT